MTATQQFIEDAMLGDWSFPEDLHRVQNIAYLKTGVRLYASGFPDESGIYVGYAEVLLDPLAWQAVGETRGWNHAIGTADFIRPMSYRWMQEMHKFVDQLIVGKTIEEALEIIFKV